MATENVRKKRHSSSRVFMWDNRNLWFADLTPMKEIVEQAEAKDGLTVCGDPADPRRRDPQVTATQS